MKYLFASSKRFLRRPVVILGEISALALAGALGAVWPALHVFQSCWFAALAVLTAGSLAVVVTEQFYRVRAQWRQPLTPAHFQSAPFKSEWERPAITPVLQQKVWSERSIGLAGSLVFHTGLLCLILAGAWRALFGAEAVVDLVEGETHAPDAVWAEQWPGIFARPLRLERPITLESVSGSRYAGGDLRELRAHFSAGEIAVNHQLVIGGTRLYLAQEFGPAALVEWNHTNGIAALLTSAGHGSFAGEAAGPAGLNVFFRCQSERPANLEVRAMRGAALLLATSLAPGETLALPGGASLTLRATPMWARLRASHDSALWLAYFGMILTMAGAAMIFTLIKLDYCVIITPLGERERVFIALRPQRFAPLFVERFEALVQTHVAAPDTAATIPPLPDQKNPESSVVLAAAGRLAVLAGGILFLSGCDRISPAQAKQLVERYNQVVSEAYRRGDVRLADPVVGPNEGRKLTGLIGVRLDLGVTLDSHLLALEITGVEQSNNELRVQTRERWRYHDLKIGTGAQVGEASEDSYVMMYYFTNQNRSWLVNEIKFAAPPQVGRKKMLWVTDRSALAPTNTGPRL